MTEIEEGLSKNYTIFVAGTEKLWQLLIGPILDLLVLVGTKNRDESYHE